MLVLNGYLLLNLVIVTYLLFSLFRGREPRKTIFLPLVLLSIPAAIGIHTVTAFLYNGMAGRPFWNASILAPRFIASAFCSGPAVLLILMQLLRRFTRFEISDAAIWKVAELMAYAMGVNLFLLGAEVFKEFYSDTEHLVHMQLHVHRRRAGTPRSCPYMWLSVARVDRGVRPLPDAADAPQPRDVESGLRSDLRRRLPREGHGARDPGHDAGHARRDLRVRADREPSGPISIGIFAWVRCSSPSW